MELDLPVSEANSNDKSFLFHLNNFIEEELFLIERDNSVPSNRERFIVFKQAFSKIINYAEIYKNLLTNIKKEYEYCIEELDRQAIETNKKIDEISKFDTQAKTIVNLEKRKVELLNKFGLIKNYNEELTENLNKLLEKNEKFRPLTSKSTKFDFLIQRKLEEEEEDKVERGRICIPGLSLEKSMDLEYLNELLKDVEAKIKELTLAQTKKYSNKQQKNGLEIQLLEKIKIRDNHKIESNNIKNKLQLYKLALNTAKEFYNDGSQYASIQDALSKVLVNNFLKQQNKVEDESDNSEDTGLEYEAEIILDYIEKFNDLFENQKLIEAAYFAVASPRNILRNVETLYRFKNVSDKGEYNEKTDPLMVYCEAFIDSINDDNSKPNDIISIECIKIALKYNKLELLTRWIAQRKLTFSFDAGKYIEDYAKQKPKNSKNAYELALFIYSDIKSPLNIAVCMGKLGRYSGMIEYLMADKTLVNNLDVWTRILKECPSIELANLIVDNLTKAGYQIPMDKIVSILLDSDQAENGLKFLRNQIIKHANDETKKDELKKLKTSYETLMKFSFLAQDEEQFTKDIAVESRDQLQNLYASNVQDNRIQAANIKKNNQQKTISFKGSEESNEVKTVAAKPEPKQDSNFSNKIKPNQLILEEEEEEEEEGE